MHQGDRIRQIILQILDQAVRPLETPEVLDLVLKQTKTTRTIVFKRLTDLRGDGDILGKHIGSGKGVWIWWKKNSFTKPVCSPPQPDKVSNVILSILDNATAPLETTEIVERVLHAIPTTRTIVFRRLGILRGDGVLRGTHIGSGKGVWVFWRDNAYTS